MVKKILHKTKEVSFYNGHLEIFIEQLKLIEHTLVDSGAYNIMVSVERSKMYEQEDSCVMFYYDVMETDNEYERRVKYNALKKELGL